MAADEAAFGNSVIIEMLETYLKWARENPFSAIGITMMTRLDHNQPAATCDWADVDGSLEEPMLEALDALKERVRYDVECRTLPPQNTSLDRSYVVWNLAHSPLGFDFIPWLIDAEMTRIRTGAPAPLKVGFWCGKDAQERMKKLYRLGWLNNVFRPALKMLGATEDPVKAIYGWPATVMSLKTTVDACLRGEKVPIFRSGLPPRRAPGYVTITLRETQHWKHRNSNLNEWMKVAAWLRSKRESVVVVRDTAKANEPLWNLDTDPEASIDLVARMNLYENAKCNLSDGGGPWQMCNFSDRPFLAFIPVEDEDAGYKPNTPDLFLKAQGIETGKQFPWHRPNQRIVWKPGTSDNIIAAWEGLGLDTRDSRDGSTDHQHLHDDAHGNG